MPEKLAARRIDWWNTALGEDEIEAIARAIRGRHVSQGRLTEQFEAALAELLGVPFVICTTSGTMALLMSFLALGVGPGDEVILPDRTFIATAHAAMLLGARVRLVDVCSDSPLIDVEAIEPAITSRTKALVPVHLNGRAADMAALRQIAARHGLPVVEDACQAFMSRGERGYLGTLSRFGCFSLGMAKLLTTGQGGFIACHDPTDADRLRRIRNQGVYNVSNDKDYDVLAGNFKFTDMQAALGMAQLPKLSQKVAQQLAIYRTYEAELAEVPCFKSVPIREKDGEIPLRAEFLCRDRERFLAALDGIGISAVSQIPCVHEATHVGEVGDFPNAMVYSRHLLTMPCGPDQPLENVRAAAIGAKQLASGYPPWQA